MLYTQIVKYEPHGNATQKLLKDSCTKVEWNINVTLNKVIKSQGKRAREKEKEWNKMKYKSNQKTISKMAIKRQLLIINLNANGLKTQVNK